LPSPAETTTRPEAFPSPARAQQALLTPLRLLVHVRDLDAFDRAARDAERERAAGIVGVHMHLECTAVADHEQRVAELLELVLERVCVEVVAFTTKTVQ
jgi:hypothetical protein